MTTRVDVRPPRPNHKRVKVEAFYTDVDGNLTSKYDEVVLEHGQSLQDLSKSFYVHSTSKLVISEVD
jgi:hypothetical protein